jgi:quercetin dioxygenase-like cupin family protein
MESSFTAHPELARILSAPQVAALPKEPVEDQEGVTYRLLWTDGNSEAGVLSIDAGCRLASHAHRTHHHHLWVAKGWATILHHNVGAGGYVHIPVGIVHDIDASVTGGCEILCLYLAANS